MIYCTDLEKLLLVPYQEYFNNLLIMESTYGKKQYIIPVLKPGKNKSKVESYRPISLTSQIGKLIELIVLDEMLDFLMRNELMSDNQHGFKKARSCLSELLAYHQKI